MQSTNELKNENISKNIIESEIDIMQFDLDNSNSPTFPVLNTSFDS